ARAALSPTVELALLLAPPPPGVPSGPAERVVLLPGTAFVDSPDEASRALAPMEGCPARDRCISREVNRAIPFEALFERDDASCREGYRFAADNLWLNADPGEVLRGACAQIVRAPSAKSLILVQLPPTPPKDTELPDMAFSMLGRVRVDCYSIWEDE